MDFAGKKSYGFFNTTYKKVGGESVVIQNIILLISFKLVLY